MKNVSSIFLTFDVWEKEVVTSANEVVISLTYISIVYAHEIYLNKIQLLLRIDLEFIVDICQLFISTKERVLKIVLDKALFFFKEELNLSKS